MSKTTLTVARETLSERARRVLDLGTYIDDATLAELRERAVESLDGREGWTLDEDGHSHYVPPAAS